MPKAVFITGLQPDLANEFVDQAPTHIETTIARHNIALSEKQALVQDAEYLILFRPNQIEEDVLRASPGLKLLQLVSAGFEHIDLDLCKSLGLAVANNGGTNSIDVAEHTIALMLGVYRRLIDLDADVRADDWNKMPTGECTYTIHGKTVGIIGLGHIGRQVARKAEAIRTPTALQRRRTCRRQRGEFPWSRVRFPHSVVRASRHRDPPRPDQRRDAEYDRRRGPLTNEGDRRSRQYVPGRRD